MGSEKISQRCYLPWAKNGDGAWLDLSVLRRGLQKYPELTLVGIFLIITLGIAHHIKAQLVLPNLECGSFINLHYILPLLLAVFWNILAIGIVYLRDYKEVRPASIFKICIEQYVRIFSFIMVIWLHFHIKSWIPLINCATYDKIYYKIDVSCLPIINDMAAIRQFLANYMPFADSLYLRAFILMFFISFSVHTIFHPDKFRQVFLATLLVQALGALSYLIMPAVGPFLYDHSLNSEALKAQSIMVKCYNNVKIFGPEWLTKNGANNFTAGLAAMPSLHIAASWVFVYYAFKHARYLLLLYLPLFLWILIEAVSAEWHYLIDLPAGLLLSGLCIWLSNKVYGDSGKA